MAAGAGVVQMGEGKGVDIWVPKNEWPLQIEESGGGGNAVWVEQDPGGDGKVVEMNGQEAGINVDRGGAVGCLSGVACPVQAMIARYEGCAAGAAYVSKEGVLGAIVRAVLEASWSADAVMNDVGWLFGLVCHPGISRDTLRVPRNEYKALRACRNVEAPLDGVDGVDGERMKWHASYDVGSMSGIWQCTA
ncbi:hypothetical protein JB92DRAFT_2833466 [Gautieria morchelliformis]|nr:hypothetical protein JB92DRAFT_2833466 [Gautieria morchelliformis]